MTQEDYPSELRYHKEHNWARIDGTTATFGITWFAQENLGEIVYVDAPRPGEQVTKDRAYAQIESIKAVSDLYAPLSGDVIEVNPALTDAAVTVNGDPYGQGWLVKVQLSNPSEVDSLLGADEYRAMIRA